MKAINSKREQYRRDIIKKQKEEFFNQRRQELLRSLQYPQGIINPIEELRQRKKVKEAFQYLKKKINESDYFVNIVKFVDEGMINVLISFLRQGKEIEETLEIINDILIKQEINYYGTFYNYGILEYVFNYFQTSPKISAQCMNILFSFTTKSNDYSQALMVNNKHCIIMHELMNRVNASRDPEEENVSEGERYYTFTLFVLENLVKIKESTIDLTEEKLAIFRFVMILVQRRLFLKQTIGFLYQCVNQLQKTENINRFILPLANTILSQAKTDDNYLYNLYALIYVMMLKQPIDLNFPQFFKTGILTKKLQKPFVYVIGKIISYGRPYCDVVPTSEQWWERLLMSPQSNNLHCQMLRIIQSLSIKKSWIWKIYSAALSQSSLEIQNESITILNRLIRRPGFGQDLLTYLHLHRIPTLLEHLTHTGKSQSLKDCANSLLEYILGPLTEQSSEEML